MAEPSETGQGGKTPPPKKKKFGKNKSKPYFINPNWHELRKQEKFSSLATPRSIFYKTEWAWQGIKLTRLMSIFTSEKVLKLLIKNQLTKSHPKRTRAWKVPCLLPIRVKCPFITCCPSQISKPSYGPAFRWWPGLEFADFTSLHLHFQFSWTSANSWEGFFFLGQ